MSEVRAAESDAHRAAYGRPCCFRGAVKLSGLTASRGARGGGVVFSPRNFARERCEPDETQDDACAMHVLHDLARSLRGGLAEPVGMHHRNRHRRRLQFG